MKVQDLKALKALIKLCRSTGVLGIEVDGIKLELGHAPIKQFKSDFSRLIPGVTDVNIPKPNILPDSIETPDALTDEELMFYSASGQADQ